MIEVVLSVFIFVAAALGVGLGLILGRGPARTSCGAATCLPTGRCLDCPLARPDEAEGNET